MVRVTRFPANPILSPIKENPWEARATFNGSVVKEKDTFHLLYRALSLPQIHHGVKMNLSTIGHAVSTNGWHFGERQQLIKPEYDWEKFGCEDPRITKLDDKYFIFYTALSSYPFTPSGIKVGVAITRDFQKIEEKHQMTYFNSKAMALFPERINGKIAAILTANTDLPPAKIGLAFLDDEAQLYSPDFWNQWYATLDEHTLTLTRSSLDHVEVGAAPLKTAFGWLILYCYIHNYFSPPATFGIEAVLLDNHNPFKIIGRTEESLLTPQKEYELYGQVPNIVFPSGALIDEHKLAIYYGAADTTCCLATCSLRELLSEMGLKTKTVKKNPKVRFNRSAGNPIITPRQDHAWEAKATFNPAAIALAGKVHLLYRAMDRENTSVLGYAMSEDGEQIEKRLPAAIYVPRESFEMKLQPGNSGCEDPRLTQINNRIYMCYTAYDGINPARVALTTISETDFLREQWRWEKPKLISPPGVFDKNACILSEKIGKHYVILHRFEYNIWIDYFDDLEFGKSKWIGGEILLKSRIGKWDSEKVGIGPPPIKTPAGWLLIYHGLSKDDGKYRLGAALLELKNPSEVIARLEEPILEPEMDYENIGLRQGIVFACGAVVLQDKLFIYYGGADKVCCVASAALSKLLNLFKEN